MKNEIGFLDVIQAVAKIARDNIIENEKLKKELGAACCKCKDKNAWKAGFEPNVWHDIDLLPDGSFSQVLAKDVNRNYRLFGLSQDIPSPCSVIDKSIFTHYLIPRVES